MRQGVVSTTESFALRETTSLSVYGDIRRQSLSDSQPPSR